MGDGGRISALEMGNASDVSARHHLRGNGIDCRQFASAQVLRKCRLRCAIYPCGAATYFFIGKLVHLKPYRLEQFERLVDDALAVL